MLFCADFTGISSPYEAPLAPEIHLNSGTTPVDECVKIVFNYLVEKGIVNKPVIA